MGKTKQPQLPTTPTYQQPNLGIGNNNTLSEYGKQLSSGDFSGNLSWLSPTVNNNNSANALSVAQSTLQPQFRDTLQQISNQAAANGQLNSSTFTDALARSQSDLNSQYQGIVSQQAINDSNQSNQNRLALFGQGLNTLQQSIGNDSNFANSENQFNLANYDNQVAATLAGQKQNNGGFLGALTGAAGGALGGFAVGGPFGAAIGGVGGGLAGGLTPQSSNFGGSILGSGASLYGSNLQSSALQNLFRTGGSAPAANSYAMNASYAPNPFSNTSPYSVPNLSNPFFN